MAIKKNIVCAEDGDDENAKIFPQRLMEILSEPTNSEAIGWLPHGRAFIIMNRQKFANDVLPKYFRKTKYTSFTRKLNRWGFTRVTRGLELGAYYHEFFQRGNEALCTQMYCKNERAKFAVAVKGTSEIARTAAAEQQESSSSQEKKSSTQNISTPPQPSPRQVRLAPLQQPELFQLTALKSKPPAMLNPTLETRMLLNNAAPVNVEDPRMCAYLEVLRNLQIRGLQRQQQEQQQQQQQTNQNSEAAAILQLQQLIALQQQNAARNTLFNYRASAA